MWQIRLYWGIKRIGFVLNLKWFKLTFELERSSTQCAQEVGELARAVMQILLRFFTQIWFRTLPKLKLFSFFAYKYLYIILRVRDFWKLERDLNLFWEVLIEKESLKCHTILDLSFKDLIFESWIENLRPFDKAEVIH